MGHRCLEAGAQHSPGAVRPLQCVHVDCGRSRRGSAHPCLTQAGLPGHRGGQSAPPWHGPGHDAAAWPAPALLQAQPPSNTSCFQVCMALRCWTFGGPTTTPTRGRPGGCSASVRRPCATRMCRCAGVLGKSAPSRGSWRAEEDGSTALHQGDTHSPPTMHEPGDHQRRLCGRMRQIWEGTMPWRLIVDFCCTPSLKLPARHPARHPHPIRRPSTLQTRWRSAPGSSSCTWRPCGSRVRPQQHTQVGGGEVSKGGWVWKRSGGRSRGQAPAISLFLAVCIPAMVGSLLHVGPCRLEESRVQAEAIRLGHPP